MLRYGSVVALVSGIFFSAVSSAEPLLIRTTPVPLHDEDESIDRVGGLTYLGGLHLASPDQRFGGLSGLAVSPDGQRLSFVTDAGSWIQASPRYDAQGRLVGIISAEIGALLDPKGQPVRRKRDADAESLVRTTNGFLVAFEHKHRFWRFRGQPNPFLNRPTEIALPRALDHGARNRGIEAAALLGDGRLFALSENFPKNAPYVKGWYRELGKWHELTYERTALFHPTGATVLPDGDLLVLERRFTFVGGFATRLVRVPHLSIQRKKMVRGHELARLEPPFVEENFEGVDVWRDNAGQTLVYLVSDNNFFPLQKTILLLFAIRP
jgi:hypothetical protein